MRPVVKKALPVIIAILLLVCLASCTPSYTPKPEVEAFLNTGLTGKKAMAQVKTAHYVEKATRISKEGTTLGEAIRDVTIDITTPGAYRMALVQTLSGDYIGEDGVTQQTIITEVDNGAYRSVVKVGDEETITPLTLEEAEGGITRQFYYDNTVYAEGGLYYGDFFMLNIYKWEPESFYVDEEKHECVFDQRMFFTPSDDVGEMRLHQITRINEHGLITSNFEEYTSVKTGLVLTSTIQATYQWRDGE